MIGIYKITNKKNGKVYIGQSANIERRFKEHCHQNKSRISVDKAIFEEGIENFSFEVIEVCSIEELNDKETFWIIKYDAVNSGYNKTYGGNQQSIGSNNGRTKLTEHDVAEIRAAYNNHERRKDVYERYKDRISFSGFAAIWDGTTWNHVNMEVYTEENRTYYMKQATNGELSENALFTNDEVNIIRERYVTQTAKQIYEDYKTRCSYQTLQQILWGRTYKNLPIYKKKEKCWIGK